MTPPPLIQNLGCSVLSAGVCVRVRSCVYWTNMSELNYLLVIAGLGSASDHLLVGLRLGLHLRLHLHLDVVGRHVC